MSDLGRRIACAASDRRRALVTAPIKLFTIGFTKKSAEQFFTKLQQAGVARVLDVRLNNRSQLAGFARPT